MTYVEKIVEALCLRWTEPDGSPLGAERLAVFRRHERVLGFGERGGVTATQVADDFAAQAGLRRKDAKV